MKRRYGRMILRSIFALQIGFLLIFSAMAYSDPSKSIHTSTNIENPSCVTINQLHIEGIHLFKEVADKRVKQWKSRIEQQCMTEQMLLSFAEAVTAELVQLGYTTSYLFYPEQSLLFGVLRAQAVAGTLSRLSLQDTQETSLFLRTAFPLSEGQVFNLRYVEQGLHNLQNSRLVPYQIYLVRDVNGGSRTELIVNRPATRRLSGSVTLESQSIIGLPSHIVSMTTLFASPLRLNDLLYVDLTSDANNEDHNRLRSVAWLYSIPYHYWHFSAYGGYQESEHLQSANTLDFLMQQRSRILLLQMEYLFRRSANSTTSFGLSSQSQTVDMFLSHQRLNTQNRLAHYLITGLEHQFSYPNGNMTLVLKYKQGMSWFGANAQQKTHLHRPQIYQLFFDFIHNVRLGGGGQLAYFQHNSEIQLSRSTLDGLLEQEPIIGKWGIRGFENMSQPFAAGDNKLVLKNEWGWITPWKENQIYSAIDFGATSNDRATFWKKNILVGGSIGMRGNIQFLNYHLFVNRPLWQASEHMDTRWNVGMKLNMSY